MSARYSLRLRALGLGLAAMVSATGASADDVTLENVRLGAGDLSYAMPRIVVRGTSLTRADLLRMLDQASPEPLLDRVRRLDAAAIELPEIVSEVATPQGRQRTVYRDVRLDQVRAGRIATAAASGGTSETVGAGKSVAASFGRVAVQELDLPLSVGLFATRAAPNAPLGRLYGSFSIDDFNLSDGGGVTTRVAQISGRDFSAKPTASGWPATVRALSDTPDMRAATPEARRRSIDAMAELFDSFSIGTMEASGITFGSTRPGGDGGRIGRVLFSGAAPSGGAEVRVEGLEGGVEGSRFKLAALTYGGLSMRPLIEMMRNSDGWATGQPDPKAARYLAGLLRAVRLEGLEIQGAGESLEAKPGNVPKPPPWTLTLGGFSFSTDKPVEGIPSDIRLELKNIAFDVPPNPTDSTLQQIASLGYGRVDGSLALNLAWNEAAQEIALREFSLDGADMGRAALRAVVGGLSKDIFDPDTAVASVAFLGASAKSAEIAVENRGLFERYLARESQRQKRPPEDLRREYGMAAAVGIPAILGSSPSAKTLAQAVARFVAKPGRLLIRARARQPSGYGAADFAAAPTPAAVLEALEITATAE